jgi:hypothetical protein
MFYENQEKHHVSVCKVGRDPDPDPVPVKPSWDTGCTTPVCRRSWWSATPPRSVRRVRSSPPPRSARSWPHPPHSPTAGRTLVWTSHAAQSGKGRYGTSGIRRYLFILLKGLRSSRVGGTKPLFISFSSLYTFIHNTFIHNIL